MKKLRLFAIAPLLLSPAIAAATTYETVVAQYFYNYTLPLRSAFGFEEGMFYGTVLFVVLMLLFFFGTIILIIYLLKRGVGAIWNRSKWRLYDQSVKTLRERYARGEISKGEYDAMLEDLTQREKKRARMSEIKTGLWKFCPQCGNRNNSRSRFCTMCGKTL